MRSSHTENAMARLAICMVVVFAVTAVLYALPPRDLPLAAALTFLFVVLIVSSFWGVRYAVFVSFLAALGFNWLIPPAGRFHFTDSRDFYVLIAFLVIGFTTSHLLERARREAHNTNLRHAEAVAAHQRFADLVNSVEGIVWEADANTFAFSFVSERAERILGYPTERWLREPTFWRDHLHPDDREWAVEYCVKATAEKKNHDFEYRMTAADGRIVWLRDIVTVVVEGGRATKLRGVMIDITSRKQAEKALREWVDLLDLTHDTVFVRDINDVITYWNRGAEELYGWEKEEAIGQVSHRLTRTIFPAPLAEINAELLRAGRWEGELIHTKRDGTQVVVASRWSLQRDEGGAAVAILETNNDITERRRAEEAVLRSENELRDVIETIPTIAWTALPDGSDVFVNRYWREYTGLSAEYTSGLGWQAVVHPEDVDRFVDKWLASVAGGKPFEGEVRFRRAADGEYRWFLVRAVPLRDERGKILKWYGIATDIEDRKRAEALLAGEKRILEMVAGGDSLTKILDSLCWLMEEQAHDVLASILLVDGNSLRHGGAPSLPKAYTDAIDGVVIGPCVGSCGTAAYRGEQVIVSDIATDPLWADYREVALPHGLRACWSTPIFSSEGTVIATFALYYREPRSPSARDQELIEQITHLAGVAIQRKLGEEKLRRSEAYLAEAQKLTHTGSWAFNPFTGKRHWSEEMFRIWGFDPKDGPPDPNAAWQRIHPEDLKRARENIEKARRGHLKLDVVEDHRIVLPDGTVKYIHGIAHPVFDETGEVVEYVGTEVDVTDRKRAEEELRAAETRFRSYVDHATDALFVHDEQWKIVDVNRQACESLGYTREELIRMRPSDFNSGLDKALRQWIGERLEGGEICTFETRHRRKDGTVFPVEVRVRLLWHGGHRFGLALARDITERRRAEEALRESEEQWRAVFENNPTMYFIVDAAGTILSVNPYGAEKLGYTVNELVGSPVLNVFYEADREAVRRNVAVCLEELGRAMSWELRKVRKDGRVIWVRETAKAVLLKNRPVVMVVCEDITERKRAEEELAKTEQRLSTVIANAPVVLFALDRSGIFTLSEGRGLDDIGLKPGEVVGRSVFDIYRDGPQVLSNFRRALAGESFTAVVEVNDLVFETHYIPALDEGGEVDGVNGVAINITERRRAEEALQKAQAELAHVSRVMTMGELTSSIAHEVNQPLAALVTNSNAALRWLSSQPPNLDEVRQCLRRIIRDGNRSSEVITRIRSLVRKSPPVKARLDLNDTIREVLAIIDSEARQHWVLVRSELAADLPWVRGDRVQLQQVILNLVMNGIEATKRVTDRPRELLIKSRPDESGQVLVAVQDSGIGLDPQSVGRVFEAFYTTKAEGMGLGLSISRSIIEAHGGRLWAAANGEYGATFQFTLPTTVP